MVRLSGFVERMIVQELPSIVPQPNAGFYPAEDHDGQFAFRWTAPRFSLAIPVGARFGTFWLATPERDVSIVQRATGTSVPLLDGWQSIDLALPQSDVLELDVEPPFRPGDGDSRELGVMVRSVRFHDDPVEHDRIDARHSNAHRNDMEFRSGTEQLTSTPPMLRITTSKACNIANAKPCVYCAWDSTKRMEQGSPDQTPAFLGELGAFFALPTSITDCSFGELPMERHFDGVIEASTQGNRVLEFTSNGQSLGPRVRRKMLGRPLRVHVSLDSATSAGYRRYRDHRFDMIVDNLRALCLEKQSSDCLPEVFVSFIVMRSNQDEAEDFLALMHDVGVDRVTFRSLYHERALDGLRAEHYGRLFDYDAERLPEEALREVGQRCQHHAATIGMPLVLEWEDFPQNVGAPDDARPLCSEPWKAAYILNRGIMPCCYGRDPIWDWKTIQEAPTLEQGVLEAVNSRPMQELRRDLAAGRLGAYCERSLSCPIVRAQKLAATSAAPRSS